MTSPEPEHTGQVSLAAGMTGGTPDFTLAGAAIAGDFVFLFKILMWFLYLRNYYIAVRCYRYQCNQP